MAFRIPSLEEARKKREGLQSSQQQPSQTFKLSSLINKSNKNNNNSNSSSTHKNNTATATATATATTVRGAKSTSPTSSKFFASSSTVSSSKDKLSSNRKSITNPYAKTAKNKTTAKAVDDERQNKRKLPPTKTPPPVAPTAVSLPSSRTKFGRAFASPSKAKHAETNSNLSSVTTDTSTEETSSTSLTSIKTSKTTTISTSSKALGGDVRDHHALLQPHVLHVSTRQRGNGLLSYIRNVPMAFAPQMLSDYILSSNRCALFLSCKYHALKPQYVHRRIAELGKNFDVRILLCLVDIDDNAKILAYLNKLCVVNSLTLLLAWSEEEAARYLETFKALEHKDASTIQRKEAGTYVEQVSDVLCGVKSLNKTDSAQLLTQFGSFRSLTRASMDEMALCPGMGEKKVRRLYETLHAPFRPSKKNNNNNNNINNNKRKQEQEDLQKQGENNKNNNNNNNNKKRKQEEKESQKQEEMVEKETIAMEEATTNISQTISTAADTGQDKTNDERNQVVDKNQKNT